MERSTKWSGWWMRTPEHDKRIANGDDFAGDAWKYLPTGEIKYTAVGVGQPPTSIQPSL